MQRSPKIKPKNLRRIAGLNGLSIGELSKEIGRSRVQVWRAVRHPHQHAPTYTAIVRRLPVLTVPSNATTQ